MYYRCKEINKTGIVDFEFSIYKDNIILISGAVSSSTQNSPVSKFREELVTLTLKGTKRNVTVVEIKWVLHLIDNIFGKEIERMEAVLDKLFEGVTNSLPNSSELPIKLNSYKIIVTWNEINDVEIMKRLKINYIVKQYILKAYNKFNNGDFFLQLENVGTKECIASAFLGYHIKNGRLLKLQEVHVMIC